MKRKSGREPKSPAFQVYPADYLTDEAYQSLSLEQRGLFWDLLGRDWLNDGLTDDLVALARFCGLTSARFKALWTPSLAAMFQRSEDGRLRNGRLAREREAQAENRARCVAAGKKGMAARWGHEGVGADNEPTPQTDSTAIATVITKLGLPSPVSLLPSVLPSEEPPNPRKRGSVVAEVAALPIPASLDGPEFQAAWADWLRYRRELGPKFALRPTGAQASLDACAAWGPARAVAAIRHTMAMGWQGMREPDGPPPTSELPFVDGAVKARAEREAARERQRLEREAEAKGRVA